LASGGLFATISRKFGTTRRHRLEGSAIAGGDLNQP
jgi:hypothetical protein